MLYVLCVLPSIEGYVTSVTRKKWFVRSAYTTFVIFVGTGHACLTFLDIPIKHENSCVHSFVKFKTHAQIMSSAWTHTEPLTVSHMFKRNNVNMNNPNIEENGHIYKEYEYIRAKNGAGVRLTYCVDLFKMAKNRLTFTFWPTNENTLVKSHGNEFALKCGTNAV